MGRYQFSLYHLYSEHTDSRRLHSIQWKNARGVKKQAVDNKYYWTSDPISVEKEKIK